MRARRFLLSLCLIAGCSRSFSPAGDTDAGGADGGPDVPDAFVPDVLPPDVGIDAPELDCIFWEFRGCSHAEPQWYWTGESCESIVECAGTGFAFRSECVDAHIGCEPIDCGSPVRLGSNELPAATVEDAPSAADVCHVEPGNRWFARGVFVAPETGTYRIRSYPYIAWPEHTDLAVLMGRCGHRLLTCGAESQAEVRLTAGDVITILSKPGYREEPPEFFGMMDVSIRQLD